jgi:RNA polymerase sigma-70 factor (ECF subfamily)
MKGVGRRDQVEACYEERADSLSRFAVALVGSNDAQDVLSVAVLNVLRTGSEIENVLAYLYRSVHRAALHHWRATRRRGRRERVLWEPTVTEADTVDPRIVDALAAMSPRQRAVVHLSYWEDLSTATIAERLGVSIGTVKRHRTRAHAKLKEALANE